MGSGLLQLRTEWRGERYCRSRSYAELKNDSSFNQRIDLGRTHTEYLAKYVMIVFTE
jgi:hypothetical protein